MLVNQAGECVQNLTEIENIEKSNEENVSSATKFLDWQCICGGNIFES